MTMEGYHDIEQQIIIKSLEWRLKKLEDRLVNSQISHQKNIDRESVIDQLNEIGKNYVKFLSLNENFEKFTQLYKKYSSTIEDLALSSDNNNSTKIDIILAYEDELIEYMKNSEKMAKLAQHVLDQNKWPEVSRYKEHLDKLVLLTAEQQKQISDINSQTSQYLAIYNDLIETIKKKIVTWDQKLSALEDRETDNDKDEDD